VLATLANRHVVFESCQRVGSSSTTSRFGTHKQGSRRASRASRPGGRGDGGREGQGDAWLATHEHVVACDAENLPAWGRGGARVRYERSFALSIVSAIALSCSTSPHRSI